MRRDAERASGSLKALIAGTGASTPDHGYRSPEEPASHRYLMPVLEGLLCERGPAPRRMMDLRSGNGATADALLRLGYAVMGVDASETGIAGVQREHQECRFVLGSVYDDLAAEHGRFPLIVSLEITEHLCRRGATAR